jgi:hypothetical protein
MWFMNMTVAIGVGVISGHYLFSEPLEQYWKEKRIQEANAIAAVQQHQQQSMQSDSPEFQGETTSTATNSDVRSKTK